MLALTQSFWRDENGLILSAELVLILTVGVLGLVVGLANLQNAVLGELNDLSCAFRSLDQSFSTPSFRGCWKSCCIPTSYTVGSCYVDVFETGCLQGDATTAGAPGLELNSCYGCATNQATTPGFCTNPTNQFVPPAPSKAPLTAPMQDPVKSTETEQVLPPRQPQSTPDQP